MEEHRFGSRTEQFTKELFLQKIYGKSLSLYFSVSSKVHKTQVWIIKKFFKIYSLFFFGSWYITKHLLNLGKAVCFVVPQALDGHV